MSHLLVTRDSWHYRYSCFVRSLWGLPEPSERTSLCPYFQTMFWLSVVSLACFPLAAAGWFAIKGLRAFYSVAHQRGNESVVGFMEASGLADTAEKFGKGIEKSPLGQTVFAGLVTLLVLSCVTLMLGSGCLLLSLLFINFASIPGRISTAMDFAASFIFISICYAGYGTFCAMAFIGAFLHWFFTAGEFWTAMLYVLVFAVGLGTIAFAAVYGIFRFLETERGKMLTDWFAFKVNGFESARKDVKSCDEHRKWPKGSLDAYIYRPSLKRRFFASLDGFLDMTLGEAASWLGKKYEAFFSKDIEVGDSKKKSLSALGITREYIRAAKQGICPIIDIVDVEEIRRCELLVSLAEKNAPLTVVEQFEKTKGENEIKAALARNRIILLTDSFSKELDVGRYDKKSSFPSKRRIYTNSVKITKREKIPVLTEIRVDAAKYILDKMTAKAIVEKYSAITDELKKRNV